MTSMGVKIIKKKKKTSKHKGRFSIIDNPNALKTKSKFGNKTVLRLKTVQTHKEGKHYKSLQQLNDACARCASKRDNLGNIVFLKEELTRIEKDVYNEIKELPFMTLARLTQLRHSVNDCVNTHRLFVIHGGFEPVRRALLDRGWKEKYETQSKRSLTYQFHSDLDLTRDFHKMPKLTMYTSKQMKTCENIIISLMLQKVDPDFYWSTNISHLPNTTLLNRIEKSSFTSKSGLRNTLQQLHWYYEPGVSYVHFPRCYYISTEDEIAAFIDNFRLTACMSLLKYFVSTINLRGPLAVRSSSGSICMPIIEFAIDRCKEYLSFVNHSDLDTKKIVTIEEDWKLFLDYQYLVTTDKIKLLEDERVTTEMLKRKSEITLCRMAEVWPQYNLDGMQNIWIIKPENQTKGFGIQIHNSIEQIQNLISTHYKHYKYVVQKYIEKPLLIYETKFDIRQWFLLTSSVPLEIWIYRKSYLRFCSKKYTLASFHESIHLTNHAVQRKYSNGIRSDELPDDNMWDSDTFQAYLVREGHTEEWGDIIYPGMKSALICTLLTSQDNFVHRQNSFQIYGADFTIDDKFNPWLVEINHSPELSGQSSKVTARLCPECLNDLIKVIVDHKNDSTAETGDFELIFQQPHPVCSVNNNREGIILNVEGEKLVQTSPLSSVKYRRADVFISMKHDQQDTTTNYDDACINWRTGSDPYTPNESGIQLVVRENIAEKIRKCPFKKAKSKKSNEQTPTNTVLNHDQGYKLALNRKVYIAQPQTIKSIKVNSAKRG